MKEKTVKHHQKKLSISAKKEGHANLSYQKDFYGWAKNQANFLKQEKFNRLDINHLIEKKLFLPHVPGK